jgi:myo-inositol 2-dehydrogenase/D-chiro-inositol 1-dehydrogenase
VTGLALVGAGRMGAVHLRALARTRRVQLRVICDPSPAAAELGEQAGVPVEGDLEQTLRRDDVHCVLIAAPTPLHEELVTAALAAGKHVLCEKPLTLDPDADARLGAESDRRNLGLHVGFWRRHAWPYREARRLLAEGAIGEPRLLRLAQWDAEPPPAAFCDPAVSGGIEIDCGVHECDLAAWLCDSPVVEAFARGAPTRPEIGAVDDVESLVGLLVLAAGQPVSLDLARTAAYSDVVRSEIVGERGALICEAYGTGALLVRQEDGMREVLSPTDDVLLDALARQIDALAAAVAGGPVPDAARPSDAAAALRAAMALRQSRLSGAAVPVS